MGLLRRCKSGHEFIKRRKAEEAPEPSQERGRPRATDTNPEMVFSRRGERGRFRAFFPAHSGRLNESARPSEWKPGTCPQYRSPKRKVNDLTRRYPRILKGT